MILTEVVRNRLSGVKSLGDCFAPAATRFSTRRAMLTVGSEVFGLAGEGLPSMRT